MASIPDIEDAFLGIDLGSTSTRASLHCPRLGLQIDVPNSRQQLRSQGRYTPGEFSSSGYPFEEDQPVYMGEKSDSARHEISLKYAFYILVNEADHGDDKFFQQYALVDPLRERRDDPAFRQRLRSGLIALFSAVRDSVNSQCESNRLRVTSIGLSIPSQWTMEFEDVYRSIISEVFHDISQPIQQISFCTETEALAHFLLRQPPRYFRNRSIFDTIPRSLNESSYQVILFLDFGGHNMNGCLFNVVRAGGEKASFYSMSEAFGVGGGSEQWAYYMGELFTRKLNQIPGHQVSPKEHKANMKWFHETKDQLGPCQPDEVLDLRGELSDIELLPEEVNACFKRGVDPILRESALQIKSLAEIKNARKYVVVSGGTSRHRAVSRKLEEICEHYGIVKPVYIWKSVGPVSEWISGNIAKGVAYATSTSLTIEEFFQQGAGFGLQRKQMPNRRKPDFEGKWDDFASTIFSLNSREPLEVSATGNDEFKIICDPFFETQGEGANTLMQFDRCYDVKYLGKLKNGIWWFEMSLTTSNNQTTVTLKTRREKFSAQKEKPTFSSRKGPKDMDSPCQFEANSFTLPLYFDGGKNCFLMREGFEMTGLGSVPVSKTPGTRRRHASRVEDGNNPRVTRQTARQAEQVRQGKQAASHADTHRTNSCEMCDSSSPSPETLSATGTSKLPTSEFRFALRDGPPAPEAVMEPLSDLTSMPTPPLIQGDLVLQRYQGEMVDFDPFRASKRPVEAHRVCKKEQDQGFSAVLAKRLKTAARDIHQHGISDVSSNSSESDREY